MTTATTPRDLVWNWLQSNGRSVLLWSDLTRGLGHLLRRENPRMTRDELRAALQEVAAEGLISLTPTTNVAGRRGTQIEVVEGTHEERKP